MKQSNTKVHLKTPILALMTLVALVIGNGAYTPTANALLSVDCPDGQSVAQQPNQTYEQACRGHTGTTCPDGQAVPLPAGKTAAEVCASHPKPAATPPASSSPTNCSSTTDGNAPDKNCGTASYCQSTNTKDQCVSNQGISGLKCTKSNCDLIGIYLNPLINFLSALVGVVVVLSIILGGIQYSTAGADPQKVSAAKNRIVKSIVALLAFTFLYAFLQFIVPGGVFR